MTGSSARDGKAQSADDNNTGASTGTPEEQIIFLLKKHILFYWIPNFSTTFGIIISPKIYINNINNSTIKIVCSENWLEKDEVIMRAKKIISRSGYSTIMDVLILKSDFEFVPTKGQAEQIYLSELYNN